MNKKNKNEATIEYRGSFCLIIGTISIEPMIKPMIMDNKRVFISIFSVELMKQKYIFFYTHSKYLK